MRLQKGSGEPQGFAPVAPKQAVGMTQQRQGSSPH